MASCATPRVSESKGDADGRGKRKVRGTRCVPPSVFAPTFLVFCLFARKKKKKERGRERERESSFKGGHAKRAAAEEEG